MGNFSFRFSKVTQSIKLLDYIQRADLGVAGKKRDQYVHPLELCEGTLPGNNLASDFAKCLARLSAGWKCSASRGSRRWM